MLIIALADKIENHRCKELGVMWLAIRLRSYFTFPVAECLIINYNTELEGIFIFYFSVLHNYFYT